LNKKMIIELLQEKVILQGVELKGKNILLSQAIKSGIANSIAETTRNLHSQSAFENIKELLSKVCDTAMDDREDFWNIANTLKEKEVSAQNELGAFKAKVDKADKQNEFNENIIADLKNMNLDLLYEQNQLKSSVVQSNKDMINPKPPIPFVGLPLILPIGEDPESVRRPPIVAKNPEIKEQIPENGYTEITEQLKDRKYKVLPLGNGVVGRKQGCTAIECYKSSAQAEIQFIVNGEPTRDLEVALERSRSKNHKKEA